MDQKLKTSCQIITKQEEVIQSKSDELEDARKQLADKTEELKSIQIENENLNENLEKLKTELYDTKNKLENKDQVIQWLNKQLTTAQARDPGLRLTQPPEGIHFSPSSTSTSTPVLTKGQKENKKPGLDPKYLEPSPNLRPAKKIVNKSGLMRKNLANSPKQNEAENLPQSVYFAKT